MTGRRLTVLCAAWGLVLILGFAWMEAFEATPGERGKGAEVWPRDSRLSLNADRLTLVMVLHPWCACSRASVGELERFVARHQSQLAIHFVMTHPDPGLNSPEADSDRSSLRALTRRIPGAFCHEDPQGVETGKFGARTSGETFVYAPEGQLLFHGGMTSRRGQMGPSPGLDALERLVAEKPSGTIVTTVFGCCLPSSTDSQETPVKKAIP